MNDLKQSLSEFAKKNGVDILGFAPKSRFEGVDPRYNPFSIFPEGQTVIMVGKRICRGALRGVEEGSNFFDYDLFGKNWLEDEFLAIACYDVTRVIEDAGWEAVPIFPNPTEVLPQGIAVRPGQPAPNVHPDFEYAAVAAGVAEIAYNGLLFSPKFGSRQRFHMVITDAVIEPTPIMTKPVCDKCGKCVAACPLGAISKDKTKTVEICGKKMSVAEIDYSKCAKCQNGAVANRFTRLGKPDRIAAACNRVCVAHLEEKKLVGNLFEKNFRQSPEWALDGEGNFAKKK